MDIEKKIEGAALEIAVKGRLETITAPQLDAEVNAIGENIRELRFNLAELEYVSSAGLRVFLQAQKKMSNKGGTMTVANVNASVKKVFDITGFTPILTFI